jgi:hypothetical protein
MWLYKEVTLAHPPAPNAGVWRDSDGNNGRFNVDGFWLAEVVGPLNRDGWELLMTYQQGKLDPPSLPEAS